MNPDDRRLIDLFGDAVAANGRLVRENFADWFGSSRIVRRNGAPRIVYHGSLAHFDRFDLSARGSNTGAPSAHEGFFFTDDRAVAESYGSESIRRSRKAHASLDDAHKIIREITGEHPPIAGLKLARGEYDQRPDLRRLERQIYRAQRAEAMIELAHDDYFGSPELSPHGRLYEVYLAIANPLVHDQRGAEYREVRFSELIRQAQSQGHDGVVIRNTFDAALTAAGSEDPHDVYIAFRPEQIKSAKDNSGLFDPASADMSDAHGHQAQRQKEAERRYERMR